MTTRTAALPGAPLTAGLALAGLLVAGLAGCGADVSIGAAPSPTTAAPTTVAPTTVTPTVTPTTGGVPGGAITQPPASGAGSAGELPAGFPLPPGTTVGPVAVQGGQIAATLTVPDGKQGYDYWIRQLPAAGYEVPGAQMVGGIGQISFTGNGCADGSQLGISGPTVAFRCTRV